MRYHIERQQAEERAERDNAKPTKPWPGYHTFSAERVIAYTEEGGFDVDDVLAYELATKRRDEVLEGFTSTTSADVSPQSFEAEMHADVIRSPRESRRFERMSSDEVRDHIDGRWYSVCFPATETSSLHASVFSPRYRLPSSSRGTRH